MRKLTFGKSVLTASAILGLVCTVPVLQAEDHGDKEHKAQAGKQSPEKFLKEALEANQLEIRAAELAQENGQHEQVKELASKMVEHHREAGQKLERMAQQKNIQVEKQLTGKHQEQWSKMQGKSGQELDKAFITYVVKDHKKDVAMLEQCSKEFTSSPELKAFIDQNLPTVKEHLTMAQTIAQELNIPASSLAADTEESESAVGAPGSTEKGIGEQQEQDTEREQQQDNVPEIEIEADSSLQGDNKQP